MSDKTNQEVFSTVPFSIPTHFPAEEDFRMNGFAFSNQLGILVAWRREDDPSLDPLAQFRNGLAKHQPDSWRTDGQPSSSTDVSPQRS